ncbi:MAG: biotin--[acetyl-CoA-carboxylase] ligase [Candidatus Marinimicrobia bacterium]|nr:biotin--[acetyl-CoA-carboxylase] ligase [Candidatus Neomarinimicrobiota bacterium]
MSSQQHIIGSAVYRVYSTGSTNTELLQNMERYGHGAVLTAACQTAGRGRYRRSWHSQKGGLYLSILLKHIDPSGTLLPFCLLSALAVVRTLRIHFPAPLFVKWPNDVYAGNRKLCGILPEAVTRGQDTHGVIGIGMNINNPIPSALHESGGEHRRSSPAAPATPASFLKACLASLMGFIRP